MKYYSKRSDIYTAVQWWGQELPGITVRGGHAYAHTPEGVKEIPYGGYVLQPTEGRPQVYTEDEFARIFEFVREDEYDPEEVGVLERPVAMPESFTYEPEDFDDELEELDDEIEDEDVDDED